MNKKAYTSLETFRITKEEKKELTQAATRYQVSKSEYIRMMVFAEDKKFFDPEISQALRDMNWEINKIGTNINQIVRACNTKKYVSKVDLSELKKFLNLISHNLKTCSEELQK